MLRHGTVGPVLALVGWTIVMFGWMYATRVPAMRRAKVDLGELGRTGAKLALPPEVARVADNYNHLHEQPTIFYALALAAHAVAPGDDIAAGLAWAYVASRIVHSFVQATVNVILVRFTLFVLGTATLLALLVRVVSLLG